MGRLWTGVLVSGLGCLLARMVFADDCSSPGDCMETAGYNAVIAVTAGMAGLLAALYGSQISQGIKTLLSIEPPPLPQVSPPPDAAAGLVWPAAAKLAAEVGLPKEPTRVDAEAHDAKKAPDRASPAVGWVDSDQAEPALTRDGQPVSRRGSRDDGKSPPRDQEQTKLSLEGVTERKSTEKGAPSTLQEVFEEVLDAATEPLSDAAEDPTIEAALGQEPAVSAPQEPHGVLFPQRYGTQPDARLRVSVYVAGEQPTQITLFLGGRFVTLGYIERQAFYVGAPPGIEDLVQVFVERLAGQFAVFALGQIHLGLRPLRACTQMWSVVSYDTDKRVLEEQVNIGQQQITELLKSGFIERSTAGFRLQPLYRHWIALIWSGHLFRLDYTPLRKTFPKGSAKAGTRRLQFVGPAGQRVLCETSGDENAEPAITLTYLARDVLTKKLRDFVEPVATA